MGRKNCFTGLIVFMILFLVGCSTEKNTFINRFYHGTTARYNGYFNANELLRMAKQGYQTNLKENFYELLPIDPLPDEKEVIGFYSAIDTAITKCTKVIQRRSMPNNDNPYQKKAEHNKWIDENWTTIGIAYYIRRDYLEATKSFQYVKKFYHSDPAIHIADMWLAKAHMALGNTTEAGFMLANLDEAIKSQESRGEVKWIDKLLKKEKPSDQHAVEVPASMRFELEKTKADFALLKGEKKEAIVYLNNSLEFAKKGRDKARMHYILGQLYEEANVRDSAKMHYSQVLRYNTSYEMNFSARLKRAFMGGGAKIQKELMKMLKDAKNAEFKDQIYYALADIELQHGNIPKAKEYLTQSAFYSTNNSRQKGMAYEKLGNMSFSERNYVRAQKYYDSCVNVITEGYPNKDGLKVKADKLADLVLAVETVYYEDSVQRIAQLNEKDRIDFIKGVIKKIKLDEQLRKEREAKKLIELQQNQNLFVQNATANKWYWNNPKTRGEGYDEFKRLWGSRENEDNWRRSQKTSFESFKQNELDTAIVIDNAVPIEKDTLTVERLLSRVPLTDSALNGSNDRLQEALYKAGLIYKDQLIEPIEAAKLFNRVIVKNLLTDYRLLSAYQLYRMYEGNNPSLAEENKNYIFNYYPNSDYANYLRDPDYFIKKQQREKLAGEEYVVMLERYERHLYFPIILKANEVISTEKDNQYRSKYMLLKAMSIGQTNEDKTEMIPILSQLIKEYPNTPEELRAKEMLDVIQNGYSKNEPVEFGKESIYRYNDQIPQWVIIFPDTDENINGTRSKVADFNREFFSRDGFNVTAKIFGTDQNIILVQEFETDLKALEYIRVFKNTRKYLFDLNKAKSLVITQDNLRLLFETQKLKEYEDFYLEYY
jgi:hypothetical protein